MCLLLLSPQALKSDIVRSLSGRIALLLEELEVTDEVEDFHGKMLGDAEEMAYRT